jgi:hypothetical protein
MTMTGTEETPVALLRVWMWLDEEWTPTNVTITAEADSLMAVDSLPDPMAEDMQPESTPASEDQPMVDSGKKSLDILAETIAKALVEAGVKIDPPAGFSNRSSRIVAGTEEPTPGVEVSEVAEVSEETVTDDAPAAEAPAETPAEDTAAEEVAEPAEEPAEEQKSGLTLNDLKEFQDLLRMI